jgi:hypothetical protein
MKRRPHYFKKRTCKSSHRERTSTGVPGETVCKECGLKFHNVAQGVYGNPVVKSFDEGKRNVMRRKIRAEKPVIITFENVDPNDKRAVAVQMVCQSFEVTKDELLGKCRDRHLVVARFALVYLLHNTIGDSKIQIGHFMKRSAHTSIAHLLHVYRGGDSMMPKIKKIQQSLIAV